MKGFRTIVFNVVAGIPAVLDVAVEVIQHVQGSPELQGLMPDSWMPHYAAAVAIMNIYLRMKTDTPVGQAVPPATAVVVETSQDVPVFVAQEVIDKVLVSETGTAKIRDLGRVDV